ncbi:MAG: SCP2 sterol-binding domain-containing protein [Actinobacteria bacterium]|nr:MAG: SCP2 sterol-binding domain-containing protein [Actinomycetota bacterium]
MTDVVDQFFAELADRGREPLLERVTGSLRFELSDGGKTDRWFVEVEKGDVSVSRKSLAADCTLRAERKLFAGMVRGEVNAMAAVLRGALSVEGDLEHLLLFQRIFPGPPGARGPRRGRGRQKGRR